MPACEEFAVCVSATLCRVAPSPRLAPQLNNASRDLRRFGAVRVARRSANRPVQDDRSREFPAENVGDLQATRQGRYTTGQRANLFGGSS